MPERKAYICGHTVDDERGNLYRFCELPENAWAFYTVESAQMKIDQWNAAGMSIEMEDGTIVHNHQFKVEEWNGKVLVYVVGPFLYDEGQPEQKRQ